MCKNSLFMCHSTNVSRTQTHQQPLKVQLIELGRLLPHLSFVFSCWTLLVWTYGVYKNKFFFFFSLAFIRKYWVDLFFQQTCSQIENLALDWTLQILLVCIYVCFFFFIWKNNFPNVGVGRAVSLWFFSCGVFLF